MQNKVELVSCTNHPIETLYKLWRESKDPNVILDLDTLAKAKTQDPALYKDMCDTFGVLMKTEVAVIHNIHFTFKLSNISIALREQLVRHRIGVKLDDRLGVDYVPDLAHDGIWSQSMRILNMGAFYTNECYEIPKTIQKAGEPALSTYKAAVKNAEDTYNRLVELGIPYEDARMIIPLSAQHDIFWTLSMGALCHILRKRGCWILQLGLWEPIIVGMIDELSSKINPVFRLLTQPPCVQEGRFTSCHFPSEIARRRTHEDIIPPCPMAYHKDEIEKWSNNIGTTKEVTANDRDVYRHMQENYSRLWGYSCIEDLESGNEN